MAMGSVSPVVASLELGYPEDDFNGAE